MNMYIYIYRYILNHTIPVRGAVRSYGYPRRKSVDQAHLADILMVSLGRYTISAVFCYVL